MKILWLCNIVLPEFCDEYGFKKNSFGGWITGMLHQLENKVDIALCFPIYDPERMKDGIVNNHKYYSFQFSVDYSTDVKKRFKEIIKDYSPDIIHIWGTEYSHTLAMVNAAEETGLLDRTVINIQGLVSVCAQHYYADIPEKYIYTIVEGYPSIADGKNDFENRGIYEIEVLKKVKHVIGRTDWDESCTKRINNDVNYHFCNEILRDEFYKHIGEWNYNKCIKHSILVSQASYPIKGLHYLLKAMPDILKIYPDAHIYVGGTNITQKDNNGLIGPYGMYLNKLIEENNLKNSITFLGVLSEYEMIEQYLKSNVFVSASTIENESNSISEALLLGGNVVSSYVGGVMHRGADCYNAYLYQHDAEYMLAFYIKKIFEKTTFENNTSKIENIVNPMKNGMTTIEIYNKILSE